MQEQCPITKITKPNMFGIVQRERLFRLLDNNRKRPIVWVSGPAGSGKTTLVASYLDSRKLPCLWYLMDQGDADIATFFYYMGLAAEKASFRDQPLPLLTTEYLLGIPVFTKRYFENLCQRLKPPFVLVFDNYQDVPDSSGLHELLAYGLDVIPEGISVVLLSRNKQLPHVARLHANKKIDFIGWDEIRFTLDESREAVRLLGQGNITDETFVELYRKTEGWMAGLVLLMEGTKRTGIDTIVLAKQTPETIFNYFGSELFEKTDSITQEFLLKTAFFTEMTPQMAEKLTGLRASEKILSQLEKNHYFIEMRDRNNPRYKYYPLFREFLLSKANDSIGHIDISLILRNAAALLMESGQMEHGALLLRDAKDWEGLVLLILTHAQLLTAQSREKTLGEWLACLPEKIIEDTPWLMYWKGFCAMPFDLVENRANFERAFHAFKCRKDPAGLYLSLVGIIDTFVYEYGDFTALDQWIFELDALLLEYPEFPSRDIEAWVTYGMFCALMYRQPEHPDINLWEERLREIVLSNRDNRLRRKMSGQLILYSLWWKGDLAKVAFLIKMLKPVSQSGDTDALSFIGWRAFEAAYFLMLASRKDCLHSLEEGLKTADDTGIHFWDPMLRLIGAIINTTTGNFEQAELWLDKMSAAMKPTGFMAQLYHYASTFAALFSGNHEAAREHAQAIFLYQSGAPYAVVMGNFALGKIMLEHDEREKGFACLADARRVASGMKCTMMVYHTLITEAHYFLQRSEAGPGLDALSEAMAIGRKQGFANHSAWQRSVMSILCANALEAGIEVNYVQKLIRTRDLVPEATAVHMEQWPWPIKIQCLRKFEIMKHGIAVEFSGKIQKKPLELLKTLIALGGSNVSCAHVSDLLWPDAEGDVAYRAFVTTLQRLRKLLNSKEAIQLTNGRLSLNLQYCWVDALAFDQIVKNADEARKAGKIKKAIQLSEKAMNLYRIPLVGHDFNESLVVSLRDSLREKFLRSLIALGHHAEKSNDWKKTVTCYVQALQSNDLSE